MQFAFSLQLSQMPINFCYTLSKRQPDSWHPFRIWEDHCVEVDCTSLIACLLESVFNLTLADHPQTLFLTAYYAALKYRNAWRTRPQYTYIGFHWQTWFRFTSCSRSWTESLEREISTNIRLNNRVSSETKCHALKQADWSELWTHDCTPKSSRKSSRLMLRIKEVLSYKPWSIIKMSMAGKKHHGLKYLRVSGKLRQSIQTSTSNVSVI